MKLYEALFRKYRDLINFSRQVCLPNSKVDVSLEFAEEIYQMLKTSSNRDYEGLVAIWNILTSTSVYTEEFIQKNIDRDWNYNYLIQNPNLSGDFFIRNGARLLGSECYYRNLINNKRVDYKKFCKKFKVKSYKTLDDYLGTNYQIPEDLIFENYDSKYHSLIDKINLDIYYQKFGAESLKRFLNKYSNYIPVYKNYYLNDEVNICIFLSMKKSKLNNSFIVEIPFDFYIANRKRFPDHVTVCNIQNIDLKKLMKIDNLREEDFEEYSHDHLTEKELEYLVNNDLIVSDFSSYKQGTYYLNWRTLELNQLITRGFIDKTMSDSRYHWEGLNDIHKYKYYNMDQYREEMDIRVIQNINAEFLKKHIEKYKKIFRFEQYMIKEITDDIAQVLIDNDFDLVQISNEYISFRNVTIEFAWKYKEIFKKINYFFTPKNNKEAIQYFPFCINFDNLNLFDSDVR